MHEFYKYINLINGVLVASSSHAQMLFADRFRRKGVLLGAINRLFDFFLSRLFLQLSVGKLQQLYLNVNVNVPFTIENRSLSPLFKAIEGFFSLIATFASRVRSL